MRVFCDGYANDVHLGREEEEVESLFASFSESLKDLANSEVWNIHRARCKADEGEIEAFCKTTKKECLFKFGIKQNEQKQYNSRYTWCKPDR